jgi:hypothetical protein
VNLDFLSKIFDRSLARSDDDSKRELIRREARIGGKLFGEVPKGHSRQFFCLDEHTWIWHEEWSENGQAKSITTRYIVRPSGIVKAQGDQGLKKLSKKEALNFYLATEIYCQRVEAGYQQALSAA